MSNRRIVNEGNPYDMGSEERKLFTLNMVPDFSSGEIVVTASAAFENRNTGLEAPTYLEGSPIISDTGKRVSQWVLHPGPGKFALVLMGRTSTGEEFEDVILLDVTP